MKDKLIKLILGIGVAITATAFNDKWVVLILLLWLVINQFIDKLRLEELEKIRHEKALDYIEKLQSFHSNNWGKLQETEKTKED